MTSPRRRRIPSCRRLQAQSALNLKESSVPHLTGSSGLEYAPIGTSMQASSVRTYGGARVQPRTESARPKLLSATVVRRLPDWLSATRSSVTRPITRSITPSHCQVATVAAAVLFTGSSALALEPIKVEAGVDQSQQYFKTINDLDQSDETTKPRKPLSSYLKGPQGKEIEKCARKCTSTCIRGGQGAPGLGPMAVRRESVVFKEVYRSGSYAA